MRVVLDTNVLVSALLWRGSTSEILALAQSETIILCVSQDTIDELLDVLSRPKFTAVLESVGKTSTGVAEELLEVVAYYPSARFPVTVVAEDPKDDKFLACATPRQADFIVRGDRHLLELGSFEGIPIITPAQFLSRMRMGLAQSSRKEVV